MRAAAAAAANLARGDLADTRKLLAPLEAKPASDAVPESDAVKADRERLTEQAAVSEGRVKQCEVVIARADQLIERLTKLRGEVMLRTLLRRDASPLSRDVWSKLGPELGTSLQTLSTATSAWLGAGLQFEDRDLAALGGWAILTVLLWAGGRFLRRRFGRGEAAEPGQRDRTVTAAIDGVGLVLVPILAVWLIGKLLLATMPPSPIDVLLPELISRVITFLLVVGLTATALSPHRPAWRILPFTNQSAHELSQALRRLMAVALSVDFIYVALTRSGGETDAVSAVGALVLATVVSLFTLPALGNRAWHAAQPEGEERSSMIGGTWWSVARLLLSVAVLSSILFALLGYATLAAQLHNAIYFTCLLIAVALLLHRLIGDLLEEAAAPDTPSGRWVRHRLGLPADATLRGQHMVMLLVDLVLLALLAVLIPAAWGVDTDAILNGAGQLIRGVQIGGVTISLGNIGMAILAFVVCILLARLIRRIVRDRVLPTVDAPMPLRQSIDAGLNYVGVIVAILIGIGALGIDFTNLAIVLGALSVGIGLGPAEHRQQRDLRRLPAGRAADQGGRLGGGERPRGLRAAHQHPRHRGRDLPAHARAGAQQHVPAEPRGEPHLFRHVEPRGDQAHGGAGHRRRGHGGAAARGGARPSARAARAGADRALHPDHDERARLRAVRVRGAAGRPPGGEQRPQQGDPGQADRAQDRRSLAGAAVAPARRRERLAGGASAEEPTDAAASS